MFALLSLAAASVADEHTAFDGVIQFDSLQTVPGIPGTVNVPTTSTSITVCLTPCGDATQQTKLVAQISFYSTVNGQAIPVASITVQCGGSCTSRAARSLLQVGGSVATITLPAASLAQLNALQQNIAVGNLINVGLGPNVVVNGATPVTPAAALVALGGTPALAPANPASPAALAVCAATNTARLACIGRGTLAASLQACGTTLAAVTDAGINAVCCPCTTVTNGAQVVAVTTATTFAALCAATPRGYPGCGKRGSKKGLLGLLGLLGLIPLLLCLLICCLCCLRRKRRGQAMLFSQTAVPAPIPAPLPHVHVAEPHAHLHAGPDFHVHP